MSHYAKLDENNIVIDINVIDNDVEDEKGSEIEVIKWLKSGWGGVDWKKTSYNTIANTHSLGGTPFRKNYAGIDFTFDSERDAFISPKPYPSWLLNEETCLWESPVPYPNDDKIYEWNESTGSWDEEV